MFFLKKKRTKFIIKENSNVTIFEVSYCKINQQQKGTPYTYSIFLEFLFSFIIFIIYFIGTII
jgi:hypothetical protein